MSPNDFVNLIGFANQVSLRVVDVCRNLPGLTFSWLDTPPGSITKTCQVSLPGTR